MHTQWILCELATGLFRASLIGKTARHASVFFLNGQNYHNKKERRYARKHEAKYLLLALIGRCGTWDFNIPFMQANVQISGILWQRSP